MPATMLSISAFAKKTGLSRQTLIYYDRLGVLPCYQRQENGYRYYHPDQIFQAARLQFWQSLGYSLERSKVSSTRKTIGRHLYSLPGRSSPLISKWLN